MRTSVGRQLPRGMLIAASLLVVSGVLVGGIPAATPGPSPPSVSRSGAVGDSLVRPLPVDSIAVLGYAGSRLRLRMSATAPDPCWHPYRADTERSDGSLTVRMIARRHPEEICIQVLAPVHDTVAVPLPEPGTYAFSFWRSDSTSLDTTLTLPSDD